MALANATSPPLRARCLATLLFCGLTCWGASALAQQEIALDEGEPLIQEPTAAQLEMNGKAIAAVEKKDYKTAITLFEASIELGELNITYLNMGRTYQRMGECVRAKETYRKARNTRFKVVAPAPDIVDKALNEYETELYNTCESGELVVECSPGKLDLFINTRGPLTCPSKEKPLLLKEGEYVLSGSFSGYNTSQLPVTISRVERKEVAFSLSEKAKDPIKEPVKEPVKDPDKGTEKSQPINIVINTGEDPNKVDDKKGSTAGKVLVASSLVLAAAAVTWDTCAFSWYGQSTAFGDGTGSRPGPAFCQHVHNGQKDNKDWIPLVGYGLSVGAMIGGAIAF